MKNIIELQVDKALTGLAGYDYGKKIYNEQVKCNIDFTKGITVIFPNNIQRIASSFVQGFFEDFVKQIGLSGIEKNVTIEASSEKLKNSIIRNLL